MEVFMTPELLDFGPGFWKKDRKLSGKEIDRFRNQNIPHNSRTIDRTILLDCIVSHKSTDIRCKSYHSSNALYWLGIRFVNELCSYQGEIRQDHKLKATYHLHWILENPHCRRMLEWFIPDCRINKEQEDAIHRVIKHGQLKGVDVVVYQVLDYGP